MTGNHPGELDLLAFVEDELDDAERHDVGAHVAACERCAGEVRALEAGRAALREAPRLELPAEARAALGERLPARARPGRKILLRRLLAVAAPAAAVAAIAFAVANADFGDRGDELAGGGGRGAEPALEAEEGADAGAGEGEEGGETGDAAGGAVEPEESAPPLSVPLARQAVTSVAGPPTEVARYLRARGYDAEVRDGFVVVTNADPEAVRRDLRPLGSGPVEVVVD